MFINGSILICRIEGSLNQCDYQKNLEKQIFLEKQLYGTIRKYDLDALKVIFQQDNAPIHNSKTIKQWFSKQPFSIISQLIQSSNLNPIKHL